MNEIIQRIYEIGIVPVIAIDDVEKAVPLAKALLDGGLPAAEVTFRTDAAEGAIKRIVDEVPGMLVGAGTVLTKDQVDRALAAGSKFLVSPGFNPDVVRYALSKGAIIIPGTCTPGEMEQAMSMGIHLVKFFPAEQSGGVAMLRALAGPYRDLMWIPTGGVNAGNLNSYLSFDKILACGGTWIVRKEMIKAGQFEEITRLTRVAVDTMLGFELHHLGINNESDREAMALAGLLAHAFGFDVTVGTNSITCGDRGFELLKSPGRGTKGHIAISTNTLDRAIFHLKNRGFKFAEDTRVVKNGKTVSIYMKEEYAGFAFHLVQK